MADAFTLSNDGSVVLQPDSSGSGASASTGTGSSLGTTGIQPVTPQVSNQTISAVGQAFQQAEPKLGLLDGLSKLTGGMLDNVIAQKQQEQFYDGMAQVVQGRALQDVENTQPWYSKIFGPNASVKGAMAMSANMALQDAQTQFMNDMPQLAKQSPDDVRQYLVKQAAGINVGDPAVDTMIKAKLAEGWGTMLETHMKQHYAYVQQQNVNSYTGMQTSLGDYVSSVARQADGDFLSSQSQAKVRADTIAQIDFNPGMDDESFKKGAVQAFQANMLKGNYAYGQLFRQSNTYMSLPQDVQDKLDVFAQRQETQGLTKLSFSDFGVQKADIQSGATLGTLSRNEVLAQSAALNNQVRRQTGISAPFVTGADLEQMINGNNTAFIRADDRAYAAGQKQQTADQKQLLKDKQLQYTTSQIAAGNPQQAITNGADENDVKNIMMDRWLNAGDPEGQANFLVNTNKYQYVASNIATTMQAGVKASEGVGYNDGFLTSAGYFSALNNKSPSTADAYFGKYTPQMLKYTAAAAAGAQPADAYAVAFSKPVDLNNLMDAAGGRQQAAQQMKDGVDKYFDQNIAYFLGAANQPAADYVRNQLVKTIGPKVDSLVGGGASIDQALSVATKNANEDMLGEDGYAMQPGMKTMAQTLHIPDKAIGPVFATLRDQKLQALGMDKSMITGLTRFGDDSNNLFISAIDNDGKTQFIPIHGDEIAGQYQLGIKTGTNAERGITGINMPVKPLSNTAVENQYLGD